MVAQVEILKKTELAQKKGKSLALLLFIGCLFAMGFRCFSIQRELWLDEIWNISVLDEISSWKDIFTPGKIFDGHSSLLTLIIWALPLARENHPSFLLVPLSLSLLTFIFQSWMYFTAKEENKEFFGLFLFFITFSYPVLLYGVELRGYSGMIFFLIVALYAEKILFQRVFPSASWIFLMAMSAVGAFLFHYTAIMPLCSMGIAHSLVVIRSNRSWKTLLGYVPVGLIVILLYLTFLRHLSEGAGAASSYIDTIVTAANLSIGVPGLSPYSEPISLIALTIFFGVCFLAYSMVTTLYRADFHKGGLFLLGCGLVPFSLLLVKQPHVFVPRYLLGSIILFYWVLSQWLIVIDRIWIKRGVICFFLCGSLLLSSLLTIWPRSSYRALALKSLEWECGDIMGVDHEFRHSMPWQIYGVPSVKLVSSSVELCAAEFRCFVAHQVDWTETPRNRPKLANSLECGDKVSGLTEFFLVDSFAGSPYSGWGLSLYLRNGERGIRTPGTDFVRTLD